MGEVKTAPVTARLVGSVVTDEWPAGWISFFDTADAQPAGFHFRCACGCGAVGGVTVAAGGWEWNGSREKPTVRPSVALTRDPAEGVHWHGWLTDGVWRSC